VGGGVSLSKHRSVWADIGHRERLLQTTTSVQRKAGPVLDACNATGSGY
jgi:hypothetical protein